VGLRGSVDERSFDDDVVVLQAESVLLALNDLGSLAHDLLASINVIDVGGRNVGGTSARSTGVVSGSSATSCRSTWLLVGRSLRVAGSLRLLVLRSAVGLVSRRLGLLILRGSVRLVLRRSVARRLLVGSPLRLLGHLVGSTTLRSTIGSHGLGIIRLGCAIGLSLIRRRSTGLVHQRIVGGLHLLIVRSLEFRIIGGLHLLVVGSLHLLVGSHWASSLHLGSTLTSHHVRAHGRLAVLTTHWRHSILTTHWRLVILSNHLGRLTVLATLRGHSVLSTHLGRLTVLTTHWRLAVLSAHLGRHSILTTH